MTERHPFFLSWMAQMLLHLQHEFEELAQKWLDFMFDRKVVKWSQRAIR